MQFTLNDQVYQRTKQQVIDSVQGVHPHPTRTWAVEIEGRWFPVKQVVAAATGERPPAFNSHRARDILRNLGFRVIDARRQPDALGGAAGAAGADEAGGCLPFALRRVALDAAVAYSAGRPDAEIGAVLRAATEFERWLAGCRECEG